MAQSGNAATATNVSNECVDHPVAFMFRFVRRRWIAHAAILAAVLTAVACSVGTQFGV
jgi:hypothetical protein